MSPSVVRAVDTYVATFSTRSIPASKEAPSHEAEQRISRLGVPYIHQPVYASTYDLPHAFGRVSNKTTVVHLRAYTSSASLLESIKTRYAYLLQPSSDGHYVIDMTSLSDIKMRKRYRPLGCTLHVTKDLSAVEVHPNDTTIPTGQLAHLGQIALAVYSLLKEAIVKLWYALAPALTSAVASVATQIMTEHAGILNPSNDITVTASLSASQKTLFPFQSGLGVFLEKVDAFLLAPNGLLYHATGMDYESMMAWLRMQLGTLKHTLPTTFHDLHLPVIRLGTEYFNHFMTYVDDALKKGQIIQSELEHMMGRTFLPSAWTAVEKLTYILWSLTYYHTLTLTSLQETFAEVGSVLTLTGQSVFQGIQSVIDALQRLFSFRGTSLVAASEALTSPALARKFISLNELVQSDAQYAGLEALAPSKVSIVPV